MQLGTHSRGLALHPSLAGALERSWTYWRHGTLNLKESLALVPRDISASMHLRGRLTSTSSVLVWRRAQRELMVRIPCKRGARTQNRKNDSVDARKRTQGRSGILWRARVDEACRQAKSIGGARRELERQVCGPSGELLAPAASHKAALAEKKEKAEAWQTRKPATLRKSHSERAVRYS